MTEQPRKFPGELRRPNMCGAKRRYPTEEKATNVMKGLLHNDGYYRTYNVYLCPFCHYWHVGSHGREAK